MLSRKIHDIEIPMICLQRCTDRKMRVVEDAIVYREPEILRAYAFVPDVYACVCVCRADAKEW